MFMNINRDKFWGSLQKIKQTYLPKLVDTPKKLFFRNSSGKLKFKFVPNNLKS